MANFDPTYRLLQDPSSFFRTGQAFAVLLPEQRVYKTNQQDIKSSKKTLYLSYQLPNPKERKNGERIIEQQLGDQLLSAIVSQGDNDDGNESTCSQTTYESKTRNTYIGEAAVRRLIVVREGITSSLCLPIQTYSGRGCIDQVGKEFFGIIYTGTNARTPMAGEEEMTKTPIRLNAKHPADSLHDSSRINYSKLYRVDHNIRVKDLGLVHIDCVQTLVRYFEESSIKLTEDLKFDVPDLAKEGLDERIKVTNAATETSTSNAPKIIIENEDQQWASQVTRTNELDIAEAYPDEHGASIFEFET